MSNWPQQWFGLRRPPRMVCSYLDQLSHQHASSQRSFAMQSVWHVVVGTYSWHYLCICPIGATHATELPVPVLFRLLLLPLHAVSAFLLQSIGRCVRVCLAAATRTGVSGPTTRHEAPQGLAWGFWNTSLLVSRLCFSELRGSDNPGAIPVAPIRLPFVPLVLLGNCQNYCH